LLNLPGTAGDPLFGSPARSTDGTGLSLSAQNHLLILCQRNPVSVRALIDGAARIIPPEGLRRASWVWGWRGPSFRIVGGTSRAVRSRAMPKERIEDVTREQGKEIYRRLVGHWDAVTRHVVFADALRPAAGNSKPKDSPRPTYRRRTRRHQRNGVVAMESHNSVTEMAKNKRPLARGAFLSRGQKGR
jgi:hypothetical protein